MQQRAVEVDGQRVLSGDEYDQAAHALQRHIELLRTACYARCEVRFDGDSKRVRMCGDGCDHLFNNVLD